MNGTQSAVRGRILEQLIELQASGALFDRVLSTAVRMLHESSSSYHWTGIYELYPDDVLRLGPFVGAPTNHVFIAVGEGVCGTAVAQKKNQNIPDVSKAENYLACSAETRSELVVLIRRGDRIYGQIDLDSHEVNAFSEDDLFKVEAVADWLAEAYECRERDAT